VNGELAKSLAERKKKGLVQKKHTIWHIFTEQGVRRKRCLRIIFNIRGKIYICKVLEGTREERKTGCSSLIADDNIERITD